jgi:hypothetical protein
MRSVTIRNIRIQFDADMVTQGECPLEQARQGILYINQALAHSSHPIAACIMNENELDLDDCEFEGQEDVTYNVYCKKNEETLKDGFDTKEDAEKWLDRQLKYEKLEHENREDYEIAEDGY